MKKQITDIASGTVSIDMKTIYDILINHVKKSTEKFDKKFPAVKLVFQDLHMTYETEKEPSGKLFVTYPENAITLYTRTPDDIGAFLGKYLLPLIKNEYRMITLGSKEQLFALPLYAFKL